MIVSVCFSTVTAQIKAPRGTGQNKDVIVSKNGIRLGELAGCVGDSCRIDTVAIARVGIVWIGLKSNVESLPIPENRLRDEVHYRDGTIHSGRLVGVNSENVITERGSHLRVAVAWIYLTPRRHAITPGPVAASTGPTPAPSLTPTPTPTPLPTPLPRPTPATADVPSLGAPPAGKRGALWTGKIVQRWIKRENGGVERITTTIDALSLREYVQPISIVEDRKSRQVGTITHLVAESGKITEQLRGRHPNNGGQCTVAGEGTARLTGAVESSSFIWKKNVNVDTTSGLGWNVPSGPGMYFVGISIHTMEETYITTTTCVDRNGTDVYTEERNFHTLALGRIPPNAEPLDPELRILDSTGNRMTGSYTNTRIVKGDGSLTVSWNICREGVACPPTPTAANESVSLGNLFETDLADLLSDAQAKLDGALSKLRTDPGLMPEIRVIVKAGGDSIFLETLAKAQIDVLKGWFAERGIDASRIAWTSETGSSDQVSITY